MSKALALLALLTTSALALPAGAEGPILYEVDGRRSGYTFLPSDLQALQDDPFENPGLLWVEQGRLLWSEFDGPVGRSCAGCHGLADEAMSGVRARYPRLDAATGRPVTLEQQINRCRRVQMKAPPWSWESAELLAMTAFIGKFSYGLPIEPTIGGPLTSWLERGRELYHARRGQLDLSCADCHDGLVGRHLRGDLISQGQSNGHPVYRLLWQTMGSISRMIQWCMDAVRAEPYPPGSEEAVALELYLAWRARGLPVETPAVRR